MWRVFVNEALSPSPTNAVLPVLVSMTAAGVALILLGRRVAR